MQQMMPMAPHTVLPWMHGYNIRWNNSNVWLISAQICVTDLLLNKADIEALSNQSEEEGLNVINPETGMPSGTDSGMLKYWLSGTKLESYCTYMICFSRIR